MVKNKINNVLLHNEIKTVKFYWMNYGATASIISFHKNKAFDCHLKLNKINFVLLEQYTNKQTNQKYKCAEKILSERVKVSSICTVHMYE